MTFCHSTVKILPLLFLLIAACSSSGSRTFSSQTLRAYAYPGSETVNKTSESITLHLEGSSASASAKYTIDDSDPSSSATSAAFTDGTAVTFNLAASATTKLRIYVKDGTNVITNEYWYISAASSLVPESDCRNLRLYEVMVESFQNGDSSADYNAGYGPSNYKGDIQGITNALDYIAGLNVNAVWLTPVFNSTTVGLQLRGTGYFADDYFNVDPHFGTNEKLRTLINEAHKRGMFVFLDGVFGHHGSAVINGVTNGTAEADGFTVVYPESLAFFEDVASYWIDNYEIDGWRLDQAYQLFQNGHNYLGDIRSAVEAKCAARKKAGCQWGVLGYIVGEVWDSAADIDAYGYTDGLSSCFDFPTRYSLVKVLASQEDLSSADAFDQPAGILDDYLGEYSSESHPNLMLTNHDLLRFGNLIIRKYADPTESGYWDRHKTAISFMAAYSGPVTLYYGDEIGDYLSGYAKSGDMGYYNDNASRTNGNIDITGFSAEQKDLHDYVSALMLLKSSHPALWRGTRTNLIASTDIFADLKTDSSGSKRIVYVLNKGLSSVNAAFYVSGASTLTRIPVVSSEPATVYTGSGSNFTVTTAALSGSFYYVE